MKNKELSKLLLLLLSSILLWGITNILKLDVLLFVILGGIAISYIVKNRNVEKKDIIIGCALGIIAMPSNFIMGLITIPTYIGAMCIFKKSNNKIVFLKPTKEQILLTITISLIVGGVLGMINVALANTTINFSIKLQWFLDAFRAGITEEVIFRLFLFAICVNVVKDKKLSKTENIVCYLIMILPHVLLHFSVSTLDIGNILVLSLLFGLPFALLQRKRDLVSAIGAHSFVDLIRFCLLGV